ncbi:MAG TPA: dienelactone hydrolase family protein [Candidatus Nitrosocosmicus sp.]|jgi:carboxymethylenebutenolidase|nr:dienelactone hydrolase family protein [Candidatus Nitrosocosmicus sp.]
MFNPLSRREVLRFGAYTTVGGVLTPGISMAQAIVTEAKGLVARDVTLTVGGVAIPAYEARPEAPGRYPVVVTISGFTGNSEQHKDVVRRLALAGHYAISPELYRREGGMQGKDFAEMGKIAGSVTRAQYLGDIRAAADFARQQSWARADRLGVTGFCGGGALTLHTAAEYPGVSAAAPWYGHVKRTYRDAPGIDAFSLIDRITMPVLGLYGDADQGIPSEDVRRFEAELRKRNPNVEFILYPGAPHAFFSDDRPQVYKKEASEDAWTRLIAFFGKHLRV